MIRRHAIAILIRHGGDDFPALVSQKVYFGWELGGLCTHDGFYMQKFLAVIMADFHLASLEPGPFGLELSTITIGQPLPEYILYVSL